MFYYFHCKTCNQYSPLYLKSEIELMGNVFCEQCVGTDQSDVELKETFCFIVGCGGCEKTWQWCSSLEYEKAERPDCPLCRSNKKVYFVPPNLSSKTEKDLRKTVGLLDPEKHDFKLLETVDVSNEGLQQRHKRKYGEREQLQKKRILERGDKKEEKLILKFEGERGFKFQPVEDKSILDLSRMELAYRRQKYVSARQDKRWGKIKPEQDPLNTSSYKGTEIREVPLTGYLQHESYKSKKFDMEGKSVTRLNQSSPTIVRDVRIFPRSNAWDYREVGPCSFLRRISSLLYVVNFAKIESGKKQQKYQNDVHNPIELQALWAGGSLYLASNNIKYSKMLLSALTEQGTLQKLIAEIKLDDQDTGKYWTLARNFNSTFEKKLKEYKKACVKNKQDSYRSYFLIKWKFVFDQLRDILESTQVAGVTICRNNGTFDKWTIAEEDVNLPKGHVFVVLPDTGGGSENFEVKKVHAEQLFAPILTRLDKQGRLSMFSPAFLGGVKTPCDTCKTVVDSKAIELGTKLVMMTDASGHYWEASGMHVEDKKLKEERSTIVFSDNKESVSVFDTECPPSPRSPTPDESEDEFI